jgi:hypothetical protein
LRLPTADVPAAAQAILGLFSVREFRRFHESRRFKLATSAHANATLSCRGIVMAKGQPRCNRDPQKAEKGQAQDCGGGARVVLACRRHRANKRRSKEPNIHRNGMIQLFCRSASEDEPVSISRLFKQKGLLVSTNINVPTRKQTPRNRSSAAHKFALGAYVLHKIGARSEKAGFRVTRLLPDGGGGLQYRIKGERDGLERVVAESDLERGS